MTIRPANTPAPKYPALAAAAVAAALGTSSCQQQVAGEAPKDIQPLTISFVDANGKVISSVETTQGQWDKSQQKPARDPQPLPGARRVGRTGETPPAVE